ncbi:DNMT3A [Symbiodinium necroappetens]|uniref:DNMT3A protein n=1 Tax=Symbiodinium necroappetens TaxID=1628268 RepID=A0A812IQJ3_9DINO|nr:DNMT3A [Symbiodinium necroappetens]
MSHGLSAGVSATLGDRALQILVATGISSDADLACFWTSPQEIEGVVPGDVLQEILQAWRLANQRFELHAVRDALPGPTPAKIVVAAAARPKKRCLPPAALQGKACRLKGPQPVAATIPDHLQSKREQEIQAMFEVVVATGSANLRFSPTEMGLTQDIKPLFVRLLDKISDAREVSQGGPTAAVNVFNGLKWWRDFLGVPMPTTDPLVAMYKNPPLGHAPRQRTPLALGVFFTLCARFETSTGSVRAFLAWMLLLCTACLRFAHLQRSSGLKCEGSLLSAICRMGKRKEQGVQQPFAWCVPACVQPGACIAPTLLLEYGELCVAVADAPFIVPDMQLPKSGRLEAGTPKIASKMSRAKFCDLSRSVLQAIGVQEEDLDQLSSYSCRVLLMRRLAIGNWVEAPTDRVTVKNSASRMPIRYSDEKAATAGMAKMRLLAALSLVREASGDKVLTWSDVSQLRPSSAKVEKVINSPEWLMDANVAPKHGEVLESPPCEASSDGISSSSSSSSDSDSEASNEATPCAAWFTQHPKGSVHLVQKQAECRLVPWCRDLPFDVVHVERGFGTDVGDGRSLCRKCLSRDRADVADPAMVEQSAQVQTYEDLTYEVEAMDALRGVLQSAKTSEHVNRYLTDTLKVASIEDLVFLVSAAAYETELKSLVTDQVDAVRDVPIELARLRAAWRRAKAELLKVEDKARRGVAPAEEMDETLESTVQDDLMSRFARCYWHKISVHMMPSDAVLARVYRELTRNLPTVIPLTKIRSLFQSHKPTAERRISLGGNVTVRVDEQESAPLRNVFDYYHALRVLGNAYAIAGSIEVPSQIDQGKTVRVSPFQTQLDYADFVLRMAMQWEAPLSWVKDRDEATRGRMVELMRKAHPRDRRLKGCALGRTTAAKRYAKGEMISEDALTLPVQKSIGATSSWMVRMAAWLHAGILFQVQRSVAADGLRVSAEDEDGALHRCVRVSVGGFVFGPIRPWLRDVGLKYVVYTGDAPLPQIPWKLPWDGPILVISLFDGISALLVALMCMGVVFSAVVAESDPVLRTAVSMCFGNVFVQHDARQLDLAVVRKLLQEGGYTAVLVAGGSPCQDVSPLNRKRKGLASDRTLLFNCIPQVAQQCESLLDELELNIPVFQLLENVVSGGAAVLGWIRACLRSDCGGPRTLVEGSRVVAAIGVRAGGHDVPPRNSFHVPSIMIALILLFQLVPQCAAIPAARYETMEGLLTAPLIQERLDGIFAELGVRLPPMHVSADVERAVARLQVYTVDRKQLRALRCLDKALDSLNAELVKLMPASVHAVAKRKRPATMTALAILLVWPDVTVGLRFVKGFKLLGNIEAPSLFREVSPVIPPVVGLQVKAFTLQEIQDGLAEGPFSEEQLHERFGPFCWAPMRRFMHQQSCGKLRPIDDGRSGGHNSCVVASETIFTSSPDFVSAALKYLMHLLLESAEEDIEWAAPVFGSEDMSAAYRQLPNVPADAPGLVLGYWDPDLREMRFAVLRAHPFGLASAVLNFNRIPCLGTACLRRCTASCVTHFFDDSGILDVSSSHGSAQECVNVLYQCMGVQLDPPKQQPMASQRVFLGVLLNLSRTLFDRTMLVDIKPGLRETIFADVQRMLDAGRCSPGEAAKLCGRMVWASSAMFGRCGRGGQGPVSDRQYDVGHSELTPHLTAALHYVQALVKVVPPRLVPLHGVPVSPVVIYTDASFEPAHLTSPGLGTVLFVPGSQPAGYAAWVPDEVLTSFQKRETQIAPLEALAVVLASLQCREALAGAEVLWFIDNQAVCSSLVRGTSSIDDMASLVSVTHLLWASMGARVWIEWVDSESNVSDGLSRSGCHDAWTCSQDWVLQETTCLPWQSFQHLPLLQLSEALLHWADDALG